MWNMAKVEAHRAQELTTAHLRAAGAGGDGSGNGAAKKGARTKAKKSIGSGARTKANGAAKKGARTKAKSIGSRARTKANGALVRPLVVGVNGGKGREEAQDVGKSKAQNHDDDGADEAPMSVPSIGCCLPPRPVCNNVAARLVVTEALGDCFFLAVGWGLGLNVPESRGLRQQLLQIASENLASPLFPWPNVRYRLEACDDACRQAGAILAAWMKPYTWVESGVLCLVVTHRYPLYTIFIWTRRKIPNEDGRYDPHIESTEYADLTDVFNVAAVGQDHAKSIHICYVNRNHFEPLRGVDAATEKEAIYWHRHFDRGCPIQAPCQAPTSSSSTGSTSSNAASNKRPLDSDTVPSSRPRTRSRGEEEVGML